MKVFKYNSSGSWEEITSTLGYRYSPNSSSSSVSGRIMAITQPRYDGGAIFSVQPNTQYKIVYNIDITSAKINPLQSTTQTSWYYIAVAKNAYPSATTSGISITRQLVNGKTEITVTTPADSTLMVFNYVNNSASASNPASSQFAARYGGASGFVSGWTPLPVKERANGSWTDGEVYISTANVWIN